MLQKIIFFTQKHNRRLPSKIFHTLSIIYGLVMSRLNLQKRSDLFFQRAITYIPYIHSSEWMNSLKEGLNEKDLVFIDEIIRRIEYIATHNIIDYRYIDSKTDQYERSLYISYVEKASDLNYFKKNGLGLMNEYYISRDMERYSKQILHRDIVDCGAFIGDSSIALSNTFPLSKVIAIEPDISNFKKLNHIIVLHGKQDKICPINIGVGQEDTVGYIDETGLGSKMSNSGREISIRSIDSIVTEYSLYPGLIKRDIEGFEYFSILGALETIRRYKPILYISVYHHGRDLFEIKKILQDMDLGYRFSFTRWDCMLPFADTILVGTPSHIV